MTPPFLVVDFFRRKRSAPSRLRKVRDGRDHDVAIATQFAADEFSYLASFHSLQFICFRRKVRRCRSAESIAD